MSVKAKVFTGVIGLIILVAGIAIGNFTAHIKTGTPSALRPVTIIPGAGEPAIPATNYRVTATCQPFSSLNTQPVKGWSAGLTNPGTREIAVSGYTVLFLGTRGQIFNFTRANNPVINIPPDRTKYDRELWPIPIGTKSCLVIGTQDNLTRTTEI